MTLIQTQEISHRPFSPSENLQVYCGLDCCLTLEIFNTLRATYPAKPEDTWPLIYSFERALQAPLLEIMQRGFSIDEAARRLAASGLRQRLSGLQAHLDYLAHEVWNRGLNPRSYKQLQEFFYSWLRLPKVWIRQKGESKLSINFEALEKFEEYLHARPFCQLILRFRDLAKQLEVFEKPLDRDGRFRASYNIGTETGRLSSSTNAFGTGGNAQNIAKGLRRVFIADPGWKLCEIDLEQTEARDVGYICGCLFGDWSYLDNCESEDLHTANCRLVWPELGWTGDRLADRKIAEQKFWGTHTRRDMTKRGGHLTNYMGTASTMSRALKIPLATAEDFQERYCKGPSSAYPVIPRWWQWVAQELQTKRLLTTPFGRRRHFFGRPGDDTTLREAIANMPQSMTGDRINLGLWRVWRYFPNKCQLLAQTHDSITFQAREGPGFDETVGEVLDIIKVKLYRPDGRPYVVPGEAKVGWNWGPETPANSEGLRTWKPGGDKRVRRLGADSLMPGSG